MIVFTNIFNIKQYENGSHTISITHIPSAQTAPSPRAFYHRGDVFAAAVTARVRNKPQNTLQRR